MKEKMKTKIIVNGREISWPDKRVKYEDIVAITFPSTFGRNILITCNYKDGLNSGSLTLGQSVKVSERMVFNIVATDKA